MFKVEIVEALAVPNYKKRRMGYANVQGAGLHKRSVKRAMELAQEAFDRDNRRQGWPCGTPVFKSVVIFKNGEEIFYIL